VIPPCAAYGRSKRINTLTHSEGRGARQVCVLAGLFYSCLLSCPAQPAGDFLQIRNGYFWAPVTGEYFIPCGFAYQTFNPPVGANQTFEQLEYDLREFKKLQANSVRAEFVWNTVETAPGVFDWSKPDFLVAKAQELNLRLFVLIGYQYAPSWFPTNWKAWKTPTDQGTNSVVLAYENPYARQAYSNYIVQVTSRYKDSPAIAGWILGNEYAYYDLWDPSRRFVGFDSYSLASFRAYVAALYTNNIAAANSNWGTSFSSFETVVMPQAYPPDRNNPLYYDLTEWRKNSIGAYVALGSQAAKLADPNHLRTYSMVGGLFGEADVFYTCEDARTIVKHCAEGGAPLDFWSINNYAIATMDTELRSVDYGIGKHQASSGLPVLVTETGHTSTETQFSDAPARQAAALPSEIWASLMSGAIGVHIFTWNDRDLFSGQNSPREKGFGIVAQNRQPKNPVYGNIADTFRRVQQDHLDRLLGGSVKPPADVQFFWSRAGDMGWCRANHENYQLWSTFKRLGYEPRIIADEEFQSGAWAGAPTLVLSRAFEMEPKDLDVVVTSAVPAGIHVYANADLPGQFNAYHDPNPNWAARMSTLFGLNVAHAATPWDAGAASDSQLSQPQLLNFSGLQVLAPLAQDYGDSVSVWKIWQGLSASSGLTIVTDTGWGQTNPPTPALQIKTIGAARTAINTFPLGDLDEAPGTVAPHTWDVRYNWQRAIYRSHFGIMPSIDLSGPGASFVYENYRICPDGSVLLGLLNANVTGASVTLAATNLLAGKKIENLTTGGVVATNSSGSVQLSLAGDEYLLLYAYPSGGGLDQSLLNTNPNKLWIASAPMVVWPTGSNYTLTVGYDLSDPNLTLMAGFERVLSPNLVYAQTNGGSISGAGNLTVSLPIPAPDLTDPWYISSPDGGEYVFHAWLVQNGSPIADTYLPVRLLWAVRPLGLPNVVKPGSAYPITVEWQELPGWLTSQSGLPLDRIRLWQPYLASQQYYKVILELGAAGQIIASQEFLTDTGTDQHTFSVTIPSEATGPFTWNAYLQTAPNASVDMVDSFEDRDTGAEPANFAPWQLGFYAQNTSAVPAMFFAAGVGNDAASDGQQSLFIVCTNPASVGSLSGSFLGFTNSQPFALPRDSSQWTNYSFSFDFKELSQLASILEMQVIDGRGGQIHFTKPYTPGANGWDTILASLDKFSVPPWVGYFDSENVSQLIVNVQFLQTNAVYQERVDNIRFVGAKTPDQTVAAAQEIWDNFDNRPATNGLGGWAALAPWSTYVYPPSSSREFDRGIAAGQGISGGQAAFMVVTNPASTQPISVFGLYQGFATNWSLPSDTNLWGQYIFSYSFREANARGCSLEMQLKSGANNWIEFGKTYQPGPDGWDTVTASVAQFVQPQGIGAFDPTSVQGIALNIRVFETNVLYVGFFDDVHFATPRMIVPTGTRFGSFQSGSGSGQPAPEFYLLSIQHTNGQIALSWPARSNRVYSIEHQDVDLSFPGGFVPLGPLTNLGLPTDGLLRVMDTSAPTGSLRFYRLLFQPRR